ncbi:MAG TPA: maleylacetoacetate isomerase [Herbaspirillum sp.]|jgi:maleylpyruvate isomerase
MKLYTYYRSSAAYRVRIALNLKALAYQAIPVHLLKNGGEQFQPGYRAINPMALLPALDDDGVIATQSLAIIEYLEEKYPATPLLPAVTEERARVRSLALTIACDIHPLGNLRVLKHLEQEFRITPETRLAWSQHWIREGFAGLESMLAADPGTGRFCHGDTPSLADCCLAPQMFGARRFGVDLSPYPTLVRIDAACAELPAFENAQPSRQPDAE